MRPPLDLLHTTYYDSTYLERPALGAGGEKVVDLVQVDLEHRELDLVLDEIIDEIGALLLTALEVEQSVEQARHLHSKWVVGSE